MAFMPFKGRAALVDDRAEIVLSNDAGLCPVLS